MARDKAITLKVPQTALNWLKTSNRDNNLAAVFIFGCISRIVIGYGPASTLNEEELRNVREMLQAIPEYKPRLHMATGKNPFIDELINKL